MEEIKTVENENAQKSSKLEGFIQKLKGWFIDNKSLLIKVFASAFIFGLIAHAFGLINLNLSHDVLVEFGIKESIEIKIPIGRFLHPVLRIILGSIVVLPWLEGLIGIFLIACSAFTIIKAFKIKNTAFIILITAILVTNTTVTCVIASFMHDFVADTLALFFACLIFSHYIKHKYAFKFKNCIPILIYTVLLCGLYQAYICVALALVLIDFILCLIDGKSFKQEIKAIAICYGTLIVSAAIYLGLAYAIVAIAGVGHSAGYNSINSISKGFLEYVKGIARAYVLFAEQFFIPFEQPQAVTLVGSIIICALNAVLCVIALALIIKAVIDKKTAKLNIVFVALGLCLLPLAMNAIMIIIPIRNEIISYGNLMAFILIVKIVENYGNGFKKISFNWIAGIVAVILSIIVVSNISVANACYVKKDLEDKATLSTMTRIVDRLEETEGYVQGETKVAFVGYWENLYTDIIDSNSGVTKMIIDRIGGMTVNNPITHHRAIQKYFDNVLLYKLNLASETETDGYYENQQVKDMSAFPKNDCAKVIDGVLVFKISGI